MDANSKELNARPPTIIYSAQVPQCTAASVTIAPNLCPAPQW